MIKLQQRFYKSPLGTAHVNIPMANVADTMNSKDIVLQKEVDSAYFRSLEKKGIYLNGPQIEAVRHKDGPLLTLAGAGSGKTSVLISRTGYLIHVHQIPPSNILLMTFSKKAADEMKERIGMLPGLSKATANGIQSSTFHSFFLTLLRSRGFNEDILSSDRHRQIVMKQLMRELRMGDTYQAETLLSLFSSYKVNMFSTDQIPASKDSEKEIKKLYLRYEEWKQRNHKIDFDDILVKAYELLQNTPTLVKALQDRFTYIMVDEFQDTNLLQYELVKILTKSPFNLFVVGDDDQTIYSFNGARNEFILQFHLEFPTSKTITLDINYRSSHYIVGLGNEVIKHNQHRKIKTLQATKESLIYPKFSRPATTDDEATWIVEDMKEKIGNGSHNYEDFAILHRTSSNSRAIFETLMIENIPFVVFSGNSTLFYEHWTVKPIIDHLRLAIDPRNFDAIDGMITTLYIQREKGMDFVWNKEQASAKKYPLIHLMDYPGFKTFQVEKVKERVQLLKSVKDKDPVTMIKKLRSSFYDKFLEAEGKQQATIQKEDIKEMLDELEASAKRFSKIADFLRFIDEVMDQHEKLKKGHKQENKAVSLMTIHKAKGLEFRTVYLIGASEGILPHVTALEAGNLEKVGTKETARFQIERAIEEERRLTYVGITRAKEELYITSPAYYRGKKVEVSRFLLQAFPGKTIHASNIDTTVRTLKGETVFAWVCSSENCIAWQRIKDNDEDQLELKACPMCKSNMVKGSKEI